MLRNNNLHTMSKNNLIFFTVMLLNVLHVSAQVNDAQFWSEVKISHKISRNKTISADFGMRFSENISEIGTAYSEFNFDQKITKNWEISCGYRYSSKRKNEDLYTNRHRANIDLSYKNNYNLFGFKLRTRGVIEFKNIFSSPEGIVPQYSWNNKLEVKYSLLKKVKPFVSLESYLSFSKTNNTQQYDITKIRSSLGVEYKINKRQSLEFFYLFEQEFNQKNLERNFVSGINYICSF